MTVEFDEPSHTYKLNGQPAPGVSSIIELDYDFRFVKPEVMERARIMGRKVHKTIELFEKDRLGGELHPFLQSHLTQWQRFKDDMNVVVLRSEEIVYSERHGYCGTFDLSCLINDEPFMPDMKTGGVYSAHKLQTAAYKIAAVERGIVPKESRRCSVYISADEYQVVFHKDDLMDTTAFLGLLAYKRWKDKQK